MDKFMDVRSKKVSNDIPHHLALSILSKLPVKSFKRFECVCKSWFRLFTDPYFMSLFRNNFLSNHLSYYNDTSLLLHREMNFHENFVLYFVSGLGFEKWIQLDWPNPFQEDEPKFGISGSSSVNGIFCLICYSQPNQRIVLWNPSTEEVKVVPSSPIELVSSMNFDISETGFGYDCVTDDYKVIRLVLSFERSDIDGRSKDMIEDPFWEIYSLESNTWRKFEFDIPISYQENGVYLDGVFHWWGENESDDDIDMDNEEAYLLSFELSTEEFIITPIPLRDDYDIFSPERGLVVLNGSIALISNYTNTGTFHILILGELGVKESWFKLFTFQPEAYINYPIGVGKQGDIFFTGEDGKLVYFNLNTQEMIEEVKFVGDNFRGKTITYK